MNMKLWAASQTGKAKTELDWQNRNITPLSEGGSLNVGKPGEMGEPMQPAMRPMSPTDNPHQRLAAGRQELRKQWDEAEKEEKDAEVDTANAIGVSTTLISPFPAITGLGISAVAADRGIRGSGRQNPISGGYVKFDADKPKPSNP